MVKIGLLCWKQGGGTNDYILTADSTATNGVAWKEAVDNAAAMALALGG